MRNFKDYRGRYTRVNFMRKPYHLSCEKGVFILFDEKGNLYARSCKYPFEGRRSKQVVMDSLPVEDKFYLKEHAKGILALVETAADVVQDYLVIETDGAYDYNKVLFVYCCHALKYYGYSPTASDTTYMMKPDQNSLAIEFGRNDLFVRVENCCVVYGKGADSAHAKHVYEILHDLDVKQYADLKG